MGDLLSGRQISAITRRPQSLKPGQASTMCETCISRLVPPWVSPDIGVTVKDRPSGCVLELVPYHLFT